MAVFGVLDTLFLGRYVSCRCPYLGEVKLATASYVESVFCRSLVAEPAEIIPRFDMVTVEVEVGERILAYALNYATTGGFSWTRVA